jgi:predicted nuclease of predicted toxin-antitoxin system
VARRFPLYTDADVKGALIEALRQGGWDVVRAIDTFPDGTDDHVHFDYAAKENRVLVTNDQPLQAIANRWLRDGSSFKGVVTWPQEHYKKMTVGHIVSEFEKLADEDDPFRYPIRHIHPPT